jgi:DNA-binding NarL/FixJ family response regulator
MEKEFIKVIIVDDELRAINRMKILLTHFDDIKVIGQYISPFDSLDVILNSQFDIVFLDIEMPGKSGLEIATEIKRNSINTKVVFVSSHAHYAIKAIKEEAFDYILKPVSIDELKKTLDRYRAKLKSNLTIRELEVIRLVAKGFNSKQIGEKLHISRHTVDTHRRTILEKTNCKNSAELITYSTKKELI